MVSRHRMAATGRLRQLRERPISRVKIAAASTRNALSMSAKTIGVALIVALYLTRNNRKYQCIIGAVMMLFELTAPLAFVLIWFYNGQRGRCPQWVKWAFYGFYPVHLSILAVVTNWVL